MVQKTKAQLSLVGQMVVVRSNGSGVWLGRLEARSGDEVTLAEARRAWRWEGAATCSGLATRGPSGGRITEPVEVVIVLGVCEVLLATDTAVARWEAVKPWVA